MVDVDKLTDAELRTKLLEFGFPVMPITGTTRKVMTKKLKLLLENKNKVGSETGRRSLGRYSSEEESDSEVKATKKKENRRATMAAPLMQPPTVTTRGRKSSRFNDASDTDIPSSPLKHEIKSTTSTTTTRSQKVVKSQDEFDTGSDSESDIVSNNYNSSKGNDLEYKRSSPIKSTLSSSYASTNRYSPSKSLESSYTTTRNVSFNTNTSPSRLTSYNSPVSASDYASDRLNQIRSRLSLSNSAYDKPAYISPVSLDKEETPFLSNFTKRLSALSSQKNDYDYKNDIIKEHDTNGSSGYVRSQYSSYRAARGRDATYDYKTNQNNILKNNFVSFAVLAGAALFFVFLAIMYLGMRSDTSVIPSSGHKVPLCLPKDPSSKRGVSCVLEDDVPNAIHLLNVVKPELEKRAIANKCFDTKLKPHMTELEINTFCVTNFAIKDDKIIQKDLRNLEIMSFSNPSWGLKIAQTENNNGLVSEEDVARDMEQVVFNYDHKVTSLVIFNPSLPWKCTIYKTFYFMFNSLLFIILIFLSLYLSNKGFKYYKYYDQKQKDEIGFMVEKIIDIIQSSVSDEGSENFVVINHVRDMILSVKDRESKEKTWAKAVKFINDNESRVRTEIQTVQGEPFEVWRWIGNPNLSRSGDRSDYIYRHGRRIVDAQYLITEVLKFPHRRLYFCSNKDVTIKNEVREGFMSVLLLHCTKCKKDHAVCSEDPNSELLNVNLALVAGIVSLKLGLYQLNELCSSLHIPNVSGAEYNSYLEEIFEIYNKSENEQSKEKSFDEKSLLSSTPVKQNYDYDYESKKQNFLKDLEKTPEEVEKISKITVTQRNDSLWHEERKKRLTASNFGRICKLLNTTDRKKVALDFLNSHFSGNIYTRYGNDNEPQAIKDFEKFIGKTVIGCGLFIHQRYPFLAASPDGLIGDDAVVEIKCPYKAKNLTPEDAIRQKQIQFATFDDGNLFLKRSDRYYFQVQGQLFVTGRDVCYFVIWTPQGLVYEKILKDEECWNNMLPKLEEFYFHHLLPTILKQI